MICAHCDTPYDDDTHPYTDPATNRPICPQCHDTLRAATEGLYLAAPFDEHDIPHLEDF